MRMIKLWLAARRESRFTAAQLAETFAAGFKAGQEAGPPQPVVHEPLSDILARGEPMTVRLLPSPPRLAEQTLDQLRAMIEDGLKAAAEARRRLGDEQPAHRKLRLVDESSVTTEG